MKYDKLKKQLEEAVAAYERLDKHFEFSDEHGEYRTLQSEYALEDVYEAYEACEGEIERLIKEWEAALCTACDGECDTRNCSINSAWDKLGEDAEERYIALDSIVHGIL